MNRLWILIAVVLSTGTVALGQGGPERALQRFLFPPELVMRNQAALGLTEEQKEVILKEISEAQLQFTEARWKLQGEMEKLTELARGGGATEADILTQLDSVLDIERQIKRTQLVLSFRIRNVLNAEQRQILRELRARLPDRRPERPPNRR